MNAPHAEQVVDRIQSQFRETVIGDLAKRLVDHVLQEPMGFPVPRRRRSKGWRKHLRSIGK